MPIDTDETGQKKLTELQQHREKHPTDFNDWELDFITNTRGAVYAWLTNKQKMSVGRIYDKVILGK